MNLNEIATFFTTIVSALVFIGVAAGWYWRDNFRDWVLRKDD